MEGPSEFSTDISEINTILSDNEIPIIIQIVDKTSISEIKDDDCGPYLDDDDTIYFLLTNLDDNIGYIGINISENCIYINYMCILKKYRSVSLGAFLAYISIFLGIKNNKKYIISSGIGIVKPVKADYERIGGDEWVLSQAILIKKFGFKDGYRKDTYNEEELKRIYEFCGNFSETYLDLKGDISKYIAYDKEFRSNPIIIFKKYLDKLASLNDEDVEAVPDADAETVGAAAETGGMSVSGGGRRKKKYFMNKHKRKRKHTKKKTKHKKTKHKKTKQNKKR